jgi:hypothetical protein
VLPELVKLLPPSDEAGTVTLMVAGAVAFVGAALWLMGVKFSRFVVTLLTVLLGACVGMQVPKWFGWQISGAGPAVGGAVVLGVSGFVLHRMWVGIGLGLTLSIWAALITWLVMHDSRAGWTWPNPEATDSLWTYLRISWALVPAEMARIIPFASATALVSGVASAILWPKLTTVLCWSALGATLLCAGAVAATHYADKPWLNQLPSGAWAQAAIFAGVVACGTALQWKLAPRSLGNGGGGKSKQPKKTDAPV